jgi:methyl-CpG-binding domain protein 4
MLNQTTGTQVHQIIKKLFGKYPRPQSMARAEHADVYDIIKTCGLGNKRAATLIRMSTEFIALEWSEPKELHGLGEYANDSWLIFIKNRNISPKDKELKKYIAWKRKQRKK